MKRMVVLGLGRISTRVAAGCLESRDMRLEGFCSRDIDKARAFCGRFGAKRAFGSIEELCRADGIDIVYVRTPNATHYDVVSRLLRAGKSVLCEKPLAPTEEEAHELFSLARSQGLFLMEAAKTAFSPLLTEVKTLIAKGEIGELRSIEASYAYDRLADDPNPDLWIYGPGGGCSLDIGVYPACLAHILAPSLAVGYRVAHDVLEPYDVDFGMRAYVEYEGGVTAQLSASWLCDVPNKGSATLHGTKGYVEIPAYWKASVAVVRTASESRELRVESASDFSPEIDETARCLEQGVSQSSRWGERETTEVLRLVRAGCDC